jgi:surfactin synthase thioesterase subunit
MNLFCFPYAGSTALKYIIWNTYLKSSIKLIPVELAGRGSRISESFYKNMSEAVHDIYSNIKHHFNDEPYAFFGHSMGAIIAYELAIKIRENKLPLPRHIFFSGRKSPDVIRNDEKKYHLMEEDTFEREIIELGGTSSIFFQDKELRELLLPILKQDLKIAETHEFNKMLEPFEFNISILLGKDEDLIAEQCDSWKHHTKGICTIYYFNGGHFFILNHSEEIAKIINKTI